MIMVEKCVESNWKPTTDNTSGWITPAFNTTYSNLTRMQAEIITLIFIPVNIKQYLDRNHYPLYPVSMAGSDINTNILTNYIQN